MALATLINSAGKKVVVESGSQQAQTYFGQGYQLMGPSGTFTAQKTVQPVSTGAGPVSAPAPIAAVTPQPVASAPLTPKPATGVVGGGAVNIYSPTPQTNQTYNSQTGVLTSSPVSAPAPAQVAAPPKNLSGYTVSYGDTHAVIGTDGRIYTPEQFRQLGGISTSSTGYGSATKPPAYITSGLENTKNYLATLQQQQSQQAAAQPAYQLQNPAIAQANPSATANKDYINALFKEAYGRDATQAELDRFLVQDNTQGSPTFGRTGAATVKDAANIILGQGRSPFAGGGGMAGGGTGAPSVPPTVPFELDTGNGVFDTSLLQSGKTRADILKQLEPFQNRITEAQAVQQGIQKRLADFRAGANSSLLNIQRQTIPMDFIVGQSREQAQLFTAEEANILEELGIAKDDVTNAKDNLNTQLDIEDFIAGREDAVFDRAMRLEDHQRQTFSDILTQLQGVDPNTLDANQQAELAGIAAAAGLPFDLVKKGLEVSNAQFIVDNAYKRAQTAKLYADITDGGVELNELLSPTDAARLGVQYGTTKGQAMDMGITPGAVLAPEDKIKLEVNLMDKLEKYSKDSRDATRNISIIETAYLDALKALSSGGSLNAPSQAMITAFNKMLDPTSVVREAEYERLPDGSSLKNRIEGAYTRLTQGGAGVGKEDLKSLYDSSRELLEVYKDQQLNFARRTQTQAQNYGLNLENILTPDVLDILGTSGSNDSSGGNTDELDNILDGLGFNTDLGRSKNGLAGLKESLIQQESGGRYDAIGDTTTHGKALGKYQIIPKFHFAKIGLDPNNKIDQQTFLHTPKLQDRLFALIIDGLSTKYNGDLKKIAAAYYGGGYGASVVGTKAGNKKQMAGGKQYPSVNEYVASVLRRAKSYG